MKIIKRMVNKKDGTDGYFLKGKLYGKGEIKFKNGDTYVGMIKGTKRDGFGKMDFITPQRNSNRFDLGNYEGNWKRDKREGNGRMKYIDGTTFDGIWKNDKRYKGEYVTIDGSIYKGCFLEDEFQGKGEIILSNGTQIYAEFEKGVLKNPGKIIFTDGKVFKGEILDRNIGREGKLIYPNGDFYEGMFEDKQRHGIGVFVNVYGDKYEGCWANDKKDGFGKEYVRHRNEYYEGGFQSELLVCYLFLLDNKRTGEGKLVNNKILAKQKASKFKRDEFKALIQKFLKKKSALEPHVKIISA